MISCICGGFLEISYILLMVIVSVCSAIFGTNWYNKMKYKKYVNYKKKHKHCECECHKDEKNENS